MAILTDEDFANAKRDIDDIGKSVNTEAVINPRVGSAFRSIPLVSKDWQLKLNTFNTTAQSLINDWQSAINLITQESGIPALSVSDASGKNQQQINNETIRQGEYPPVLGSPVKLRFIPDKASLIYGISDPEHLDDNLNNFRGLNHPNAYDESNIKIGAVSFGRNNPPFAYLALAMGHDCVPFGVASIVGGAGSCTGNPDVPADGANYGYCSLAVGKDTQARGRISNAMGHLNLSESRYSSTDGYSCIAGAGLTSHPNGVASEGAAARAHGYNAQAFGNFAFAYGTFLRAYNGSQVIGKGINDGSPLQISKGGLAFGFNVDVPTIYCAAGSGVQGGTAWVGFNTENPRSMYWFNMGASNAMTLAINTTSGSGAAALETKGLLNNGEYTSLHNIVVTHPNSGGSFSNVTYYLNGQPYMAVTQDRKIIFYSTLEASGGVSVGGKQVVGAQLGAIQNSNGTLEDNTRVNNAILAVLRGHGLIAS